MRKVLMMFLCSVSIIASATDYYVSSSGNDSANGLSSSTPWQSIAKINSEFSRFNPGDRILFNKGDTFFGTLNVNKGGASGNPIVFGAYGTGSEPVISGFNTVSGWRSEGSGIYSKVVQSESSPNMVLLDGTNTAKGRWPNTGWMIFESHSGSTSLSDNQLPASPNWTGAEIVVRTYQSVVDRSVVSNHSGQNLTFSALTQDPVNGSGYFIQNHRGTLDSYGEWCYSNGTFYMYFGSENPDNHIVKVSTVDRVIEIDYKNYITIENIHIEGANESGIFFNNSDYITVRNSIVENNGEFGINGEWGSDHSLVENNTIRNNNDNGIYFNVMGCTYTIVRSNNISYSGYLVGMGGNGYNSYCGLINWGNNSLSTYNKVEYSGYCGIKWGGQDSEVSYNFVNFSCLCKDDGAGIYSWRDYSTNKVLKNNIVLNSTACPEGWHYFEEVRAHGIYLDGAYNVLVTNNTLAGNDGCGIFINATRGITAEYNTCYDNTWGIRILSEADIGLARNHNINNNILVAKEYVSSSPWKQSAFSFVTKFDASDIYQFGTSDYNYFARPVNNDNYLDIWKNAWGWAPGDREAYNLAEWQSAYGKDLHSSTSSVTVSDPGQIRFEYNASGSAKVVPLDASYIDVKGAKFSGSITLQPYTSAVLMVDPNPSAPPATPVYVSSAIENTAPSVIEMTYSLTLANIVPPASAFTVQVNSVTRSVTSVSVSGSKVLLTLASPVANGNTVSVSYTVPSSNPIQTPAGGKAEGINSQTVTNRVNPPSSPVYISSAIENASPSVIEMTYSLSLANIVPAVSAFAVMVNSVARSVSSVSVSGTKVLLTLSSAVAYGNSVTVAYTAPSSNPLQTPGGGLAASISAQSVTNRINAPPAIPAYVSSAVENASPSVVEITFNLSLANIVPAVSAFSVNVNSAARTLSSVSISGTKVLLTLSSPVVYGNSITVAYTKPSTNPVQTPAGGQAASFSAQSVTNRVNAVTTPPPVVVPPPTTPNTPPVIVVSNISGTYSGFVGELNAGGSYDADKDNLTFSWNIPGNIPVSSTNSAAIEFLAPVVSSNQTFDFTITVSDGKTSQVKTIPVQIVPYQPGLETAEVISVEAGEINSTHNPYNIIDGNIGTIWSANGNDQWIILELNGSFAVHHVKLAFQPGQKRESYFDIYGSNDKETWEPILLKSKSCAFSGDLQVFDFPASKTGKEFRYIKLIGQGNSTDSWNHISEFRIFGYKHKNPTDYENQVVKIYPNPARELVNILIDEPTFNPDFIKIISLAGKIIFADNVDPGIKQLQIPVAFKQGVYVVQMGTGDITVFTQKLIVIN